MAQKVLKALYKGAQALMKKGGVFEGLDEKQKRKRQNKKERKLESDARKKLGEEIPLEIR